MKKILKINIPYFVEGELRHKLVDIYFVSNWCIREYNKNIKLQIEYSGQVELLSKLKTDILVEKDKGKIKENLKSQNKIMSYIDNFKECGPFYIIERILNDNEINDKQLHDQDFWYKCIHKDFMPKFLTDCIFKDIDITEEKKTSYVLHEDRLLIALNKYWRPIDMDYYLNKMDIPDTNEAIIQSQMPEYVQKRIWEKEKKIELFNFFANWSH